MRERTWRQKAHAAAMFRSGLINSLIREAMRLEEQARKLREIANNLMAEIEL